MEDLHPFVLNIVNLWNIHLRRENLYKQAMGFEDLGSLRRTCSQGYGSSLLFKKEIQWVYDQVKCSLLDGDIRNSKQTDNRVFIFPWEDKTSIAFMLQEQEQRAMRIYKKLLAQKNYMTLEANYIFNDHLVKIEDINKGLSKALTKSIYLNGFLQYAS